MPVSTLFLSLLWIFVIPTTAAFGQDSEPNDRCFAAQNLGAVALPFVQSGSLDSDSDLEFQDVDFFRIVATPGSTAQIDLEAEGTGTGTLEDPFLGAFDSACDSLETDDNGGMGLDSRLTVDIPSDGILILGVTESGDVGFTGGGVGSYRLVIGAGIGASVTGTNDPGALASALAVDAPAVASLEVDYAPPFPQGTGASLLAGFPTHGSTFAVMTSGDAELADDPNDEESSGFGHGVEVPARGEAFDAQTLRVDVNVPGNANCVAFDYRFLSEEVPEFINAGFNDAFIAELDQSTWSVSESTITARGNFASTAGDLISVDTQGPSGMSREEALGTTYDGATPKLTAMTPVSSGPHSVFFSIFDAGDSIFDSAVFIDNLRFVNLPPEACETPFDVELVNTRLTCQSQSCRVAVTCNLPAQLGTPCSSQIDLFVQRAASRFTGVAPQRAPKRSRFAFGIANVAPGAIATVKLRLTKRGKRIVRTSKKRLLNGVIEVRNAPGTAIDSTAVRIRLKRR